MPTELQVYSAPPLPRDPSEARRVAHSRLRRRILYGEHEEDLRDRLKQAIGHVRQEAWGPIDMTSNPYLKVWTQLAALYRQSPEVVPPEGGEDVAQAVAQAGFWTLMQRVQRDVLAMREELIRIDIVDGEPVFRPVPADMVQLSVDPERPTIPVAVKEWVRDPDAPDNWVCLVTDPREASYRAEDDDGVDVSERVLGGRFEGEAYPWRVNGLPVLPYVLYHAADTGWVFDPYTGREMVEGTLQLGIYYTFYGHVLRNAAWAQKWTVNAVPMGADVADGGRRAEIVTDPATLMVLQQVDEAFGQAMVGQWNSPTNPDTILQSVMRYERRLVEMALGQAEVSRLQSDVRSAMSLAVSREEAREAQRAFEPLFRRADLQVLRLVAGLLGGPQDGWRVLYKSIPKDPQEQRAELDRLTQLLEAGLIDKVQAYMELNPGITVTEAQLELEAIARTNRALT